MNMNDYHYSTSKKEGDYVVLDYTDIKFVLKYHILPYYSKKKLQKSGIDRLTEKEMDYFIADYIGVVQKSETPRTGNNFVIKHNDGVTFLISNDNYLNECSLVRSEQEAKEVLYVHITRAINEIQTSFWQKTFSKRLNII